VDAASCRVAAAGSRRDFFAGFRQNISKQALKHEFSEVWQSRTHLSKDTHNNFMCGIAGFSGSFDSELLERMVSAISHRGPDDRGIRFEPETGIGLGHARLSIIDLSPDGHQPMTNEDGTLWLVYNGEIYNFKELARALEEKGHRFRSRTDSEVLLHLYEERGAAMLSDLNGIFAFALWDSRRREMLLARDALGVKPLYFSPIPKGVLFASEIKSLLECPDIPREIDLGAMHQYITYMWAPAPNTMFQAIRKLPPGHFLILKEGKIAKESTWYIMPYDGSRLPGTETDIARELAIRVETAVNRQLMADVPVGAFLSGGLDSSAIVAMIRRLRPADPVPCYSIGFPDDLPVEDCPSDLPYARRVAKHLGVDLREIIVKPEQLAQKLQELIFFLDEPQSDPAPINAMLIAEAAHRDGIKVLLSGAGGDDLLTGYRRHFALSCEHYWDWLPAPVRRLAGNLIRRIGNVQQPFFRRLKKGFGHMGLDGDDRLAAYFKWSPDDVRQSLFHPDVRASLDRSPVDAQLLASLGEIPLENDRLNRMLHLEAKHFLCDHNLNYTDKTSMRHGVETRVPLLDLDLVRFATRIPPEMKQKGTIGKAIFKKAMEPFLPKGVIYREKTGFGAPLRRWIKSDLRETIGEVLSPAAIRARGLFDPKGIQALMEADLKGRVDGAYTVFAVLCVELWCRLFIDGKGRAGSWVTSI